MGRCRERRGDEPCGSDGEAERRTWRSEAMGASRVRAPFRVDGDGVRRWRRRWRSEEEEGEKGREGSRTAQEPAGRDVSLLYICVATRMGSCFFVCLS